MFTSVHGESYMTGLRKSILATIDTSKLGLVGLIALIIIVSGLSNFLIGVAARNHPDNPLAQASHFFWQST